MSMSMTSIKHGIYVKGGGKLDHLAAGRSS